MNRIKLAIAGVGNCASALLQGIEYYRHGTRTDSAGLLHFDLGGYHLGDIRPVAAFDIDRRKVGRPLEEAIFERPKNDTAIHLTQPSIRRTFQSSPGPGVVADHMSR